MKSKTSGVTADEAMWTFSLGDQAYGAAVIDWDDRIQLPESGEGKAGGRVPALIQWNGKRVPVFDMRGVPASGKTPAQPSSLVIVSMASGGAGVMVLGLLVNGQGGKLRPHSVCRGARPGKLDALNRN